MKLKKITQRLLAIVLTLTLANVCVAEETNEATETIKVSISEDGKIQGQVFTMLDNEKAPLIGKVSLTAFDGESIATSDTDEDGNFAFQDVEPGTYKAIGVAGDYVGDAEIEVTESKGEYTSIPLAVAPAATGSIIDTYASLPAASFSAAPAVSYAGGYSVGGCSTCSSGGSHSYGRVGGCSSCGGCGSCGGGGLFRGGGGLNFRRLALIGGVVGLVVGISSNPSSPDE